VKRKADASGNRGGSGRTARPPAGGTARGDRPGQSSDLRSAIAKVLAHRKPAPFHWYGKQGWARPHRPHAVWHFWRHGHTVCGAYQWEAEWAPPILEKKPPSHRWTRRCARCELRRAQHTARHLWRDRHGV